MTEPTDEVVGFHSVSVIRSGRVVANGPVAETMTGPVLTEAFGLALRVARAAD
jgi:ABC-type cobalamin/Fe3+-siderophores transport system ATPase subunit